MTVHDFDYDIVKSREVKRNVEMQAGFVIILLLVVFWIYKVIAVPVAKGDLKKIPGPPPSFFFGNVLEFMSDPLATFISYAKQYGPDGIYKYYYFNQPIVVISDPSLVKQILSTKSKNMWKFQEEIILDVIGKGILLSNGVMWKKHRDLMNPAFGFSYMKHMIPKFVEITNVLINKWERTLPERINIHLDMTRLTLDVIGIVGFGYNFNSLTDDNGPLPSAVGKVLHLSELRIFQLLPIWKIPFLPSTVEFEKSKKILLNEIEKMIRERKEKGVSTEDPDLLGRLLAAEGTDGERISDEQLRDELITFLIAGHETTAAMLAFTYYSLSKYPEIQKKAQEEIDQVLQGREPSSEDLSKLTYLELVMKETLRIYPSVSMMTTRVAMEDEQIGEYILPKGTNVEIWPMLIHHDEKQWKNPEVYDPDRHLEKREQIFSYIPFGAGGRECIGKRLALSEAKVVLAMTLQRFWFEFPTKKMTPKLTVTLRPDELIMTLKRRNKEF